MKKNILSLIPLVFVPTLSAYKPSYAYRTEAYTVAPEKVCCRDNCLEQGDFIDPFQQLREGIEKGYFSTEEELFGEEKEECGAGNLEVTVDMKKGQCICTMPISGFSEEEIKVKLTKKRPWKVIITAKKNEEQQISHVSRTGKAERQAFSSCTITRLVQLPLEEGVEIDENAYGAVQHKAELKEGMLSLVIPLRKKQPLQIPVTQTKQDEEEEDESEQQKTDDQEELEEQDEHSEEDEENSF